MQSSASHSTMRKRAWTREGRRWECGPSCPQKNVGEHVGLRVSDARTARRVLGRQALQKPLCRQLHLAVTLLQTAPKSKAGVEQQVGPDPVAMRADAVQRELAVVHVEKPVIGRVLHAKVCRPSVRHRIGNQLLSCGMLRPVRSVLCIVRLLIKCTAPQTLIDHVPLDLGMPIVFFSRVRIRTMSPVLMAAATVSVHVTISSCTGCHTNGIITLALSPRCPRSIAQQPIANVLLALGLTDLPADLGKMLGAQTHRTAPPNRTSPMYLEWATVADHLRLTCCGPHFNAVQSRIERWIAAPHRLLHQ
mmetsp:Transcript_9530/g.27455  ORF Transcript_9530/g.27455 Transcript_9530/m.27455 type:complete len:305 (+) Transcript_9530:450-1364(+)